MKVAQYYSNTDVRIIDLPKPEPGFGEIVVKTKACGVCFGDTMEWYLQPRAPLTFGHEATGIIDSIGQGVSGFKEGDRVFVHHHVPCLTCEYCRKGNFTMCRTFRNTHLEPGGYSEYFKASKSHVDIDTLILPDSVSFEAGTLIEPLACVIHAIRRMDIHPGENVILIGTGTMGLLFIEALHYWGIRNLIVYEVLDWRKEKAFEFGAPIVLSPFNDLEKEFERVQNIFKTNGGDKVIIATKNLDAIKLGFKLTNKAGIATFFATPHPDDFVEINPSNMFFNETTITSTYSADHIDTRLALDLIANGEISTKKLITNKYSLENLSDAILQTLSRNNSLKCIIEFDR